MTLCPQHPIKIPDDREVVLCDELEFPWTQDENGYFLVKIEKDLICCGHVNNEHQMITEFRAKDPDKIIKEIARRELCDLVHMGYIAQELQIAKECMGTGEEYIQR